MELLFKAGLSTVEVLQTATSLPAKYINLRDRDIIQPGLQADLFFINGDPIQGIGATRQI